MNRCRKDFNQRFLASDTSIGNPGYIIWGIRLQVREFLCWALRLTRTRSCSFENNTKWRAEQRPQHDRRKAANHDTWDAYTRKSGGGQGGSNLLRRFAGVWGLCALLVHGLLIRDTALLLHQSFPRDHLGILDIPLAQNVLKRGPATIPSRRIMWKNWKHSSKHIQISKHPLWK